MDLFIVLDNEIVLHLPGSVMSIEVSSRAYWGTDRCRENPSSSRTMVERPEGALGFQSNPHIVNERAAEHRGECRRQGGWRRKEGRASTYTDQRLHADLDPREASK